MNYIIGLTGGIGSGKTTVTNEFAKLGVDIVDADVVSHQVTAKDQAAVKKIHQYFGDDVLDNQGNLNRAWLRKRVFANPEDKQWLESLLHPLIAETIIERLDQAQSPYVIFVSPLLLESQQKLLCRRIVVVDVDEQTQVQRTIDRDGSSRETVEAIMDSQINREDRLAAANDVIDNSQGMSHLLSQILELHDQYLSLAEKAEASG